jgi:hypothetical protein
MRARGTNIDPIIMSDTAVEREYIITFDDTGTDKDYAVKINSVHFASYQLGSSIKLLRQHQAEYIRQ